MIGRNLLLACLGLGTLAVGTGCSAPVAAKPVDRGRPIDREAIDRFRRGFTTRAEALEQLGNPDSQRTNAEDGSTTLAWSYVHTDEGGTVSMLAVLQFDAHDRLLFKAVTQDRQK